LQEEIYANFLQTIRLFSYLERHVVREIAKEAVQVRMMEVCRHTKLFDIRNFIIFI
jgi:hypothetical protein